MNLLRRSNRPLTAYEIAERASDHDSPISPAQVYRVLDRLVTGSEVERIELLAAYLPRQGEQHGFLVCRQCRSVRPFPLSIPQATVRRLCRTADFHPTQMIVESWGICGDCEDGKISAPGKKQPVSIRMKGLLGFIIAAGAMVTTAPADAAERDLLFRQCRMTFSVSR